VPASVPQNQARLARLQQGTEHLAHVLLANRADGKVYAQQSGALQGIVIAHDLREVSTLQPFFGNLCL